MKNRVEKRREEGHESSTKEGRERKMEGAMEMWQSRKQQEREGGN